VHLFAVMTEQEEPAGAAAEDEQDSGGSD